MTHNNKKIRWILQRRKQRMQRTRTFSQQQLLPRHSVHHLALMICFRKAMLSSSVSWRVSHLRLTLSTSELQTQKVTVHQVSLSLSMSVLRMVLSALSTSSHHHSTSRSSRLLRRMARLSLQAMLSQLRVQQLISTSHSRVRKRTERLMCSSVLKHSSIAVML